jgi:drug/metabolite transporter (DMT)-like permease
VNTAFAFYLWNQTLKVLRAFELSILQNTMLIQVAVLAWIFLGERVTNEMAFGMVLVLLGVALVQKRQVMGGERLDSRVQRN